MIDNKPIAKTLPSFASLAALVSLAGCGMMDNRAPITVSPASEAMKQPVIIVAELKDRQVSGPRYNAHGGIIPDPAPITPVDESSIGEVSN